MIDTLRRQLCKRFHVRMLTACCFASIAITLSLVAAIEGTAVKAQTTEPQAIGILRVRVRPKIDGKEKGLGRKRFYLIEGGLDANEDLVEKINAQTALTPDCYYRNAGATEGFIKWLKLGDCESVYCREIEDKFITGAEKVREFELAYERSVKDYKTAELGKRWLTTNLPAEIRDGFYRRKQSAIKTLIGEAERVANMPVISVMTDAKGTAYFTDLAPGTYLVTNLVPIEIGGSFYLWTYEVKVKAGDSIKKTLQIPNLKDKNIKGSVIEKPLPACAAATSPTVSSR
jgi:hypothetical protein